ncbi:receptor-type tyrosine-protein phosphatase eta isoform X2 [Pipistrellus kuhlii]|uniref:Receptor-type tyrosine-protein phosphatase eta n=1 Tax=Pipistrellus kuhlii TaxID=59472 RepID=A0A7J7X255_PIPKU|nr:receptor-type tyrosine-protein phosphatase eta isoform X2 [Pipistrellus kuhlii]KAF6343536.1 protein tyrosine phosphatase receptor type J [Pipistrellus kuhlii]
MTRRAGSGSRRSRRGSRGPVAAHRGWAPLAPPRGSPARPGTRPSRDRLVGPGLEAAAAAMSRGKPGAGGAGTRRTGWRRRRRRRRLEAAIAGAPRLGRTAGPDSRGPGALQGARGMKPAAREARPPRRSPGLRWALPPLLLLCRLGQILCTDACSNGSCGLSTAPSTTTEILTNRAMENLPLTTVIDVNHQDPQHLQGNSDNITPVMGLAPAPSPAISISPTSVNIVRKNNDSAAFHSEGKEETKSSQQTSGENQSGTHIPDSSPTNLYTFSITPANANFSRDTTEALPVSGLRVATGVTTVALSWKNNGTTTYWMLLEAMGNHKESASISVRKPEVICKATLNVSESDNTERERDATCTERSAQTLRSLTAPEYTCQLEPQDPPTAFPPTDVKVLLLGLKSDMRYKATVYSRAPTGEEAHPCAIEFSTQSIAVFDLKAPDINITATSMILTWKINVTDSLYNYEIHVAGETASLNLTVNETWAFITPLNSNTLYNITVHPLLQDGSAGMPGFLQVYTRPRPVSDFRVTNVTTRTVSLAWSSNDSVSFKILTPQGGAKKSQTTTNETSIVIDGLYPGTEYCFEIFPQGPNGTEGDSQTVCNTTDSAAVFDIRVVNVTTTEMGLEWQSIDNASDYIYHLQLESQHGSSQMNSFYKAITLRGLIPGTLYNITIVPEVNGVRGISRFIKQYTRPSNVFNIEISTNTTSATFRWNNSDKASPTYVYRLLIEKDGDSSNATEIVTDTGITNAMVTELTPGSRYRVKIFTLRNATWSLDPGWKPFCTDPAPVASFQCEGVPKTPALVLKWACPPGTNKGFKLGVSSGDWKNTTILKGCSSEDGTEYRTEITYLNFSTLYNISITALSCDKMAPPSQNTCLTGITDPPPPDESPNITYVSHNSVKIKFSGFEASNGPIQAYAVILTTGEANPSAEDLSHTYGDFKRGSSATYVTYLLTTDQQARSQGPSEALKYEIDVGNESNTHGYYNGKLEPLGSYRACVAGFTNITFSPESGLIDGNGSYVSFSRYSEAVSLPQDPGVICGAVFGCIFGAVVIVAVGGFIFWKKKRKEEKNNEVSFSQIKPKKSKLVRVENFETYFKKQQADSNCGFAEEYEDLKLVGISQPKYAAELAENRGKNRYNNVLPYDISRVRLSVQTHSADDYINANYMPGYHSKKDFIATQGPLPNTLKDFWRMVWEKNVHAIVMLTKCVEQGRTKCEEYWPSKQAKDYGDITVAMTSEIVLPEWTIRDFIVKNKQTSDSHPLRQFHFTSWPDHGVPDTTDLLINFRYLVRDYMKQSPSGSPILVHCSAGVGRTGTFIAIDRLIYQIENEYSVDVYGIVYDLRMHRPLMVQTEDQYVFLNQCVLDIIRSHKDSKVDLIYQNTTAMTIYENIAPMATFGQTNGYIA